MIGEGMRFQNGRDQKHHMSVVNMQNNQIFDMIT